MATNQHSLLRQWHMLRLVPRAPAKISAKELCERLRSAEFPVTERTVQRDLNELASVFPLVADDREKPYGWSWQRDAASFDLPGLCVPEALTLALVEQHLQHYLPPNAADALRPHFESAARTLATIGDDAGSNAWLKKVRAVPSQQPLLPPATDADIQRVVYDALMHDRVLRIHYKKRDATIATVYDTAHPLAVVQRGAISYLVCMFAQYEDVRTLALHRVQAVEMLYEPARRLPSFDLDEFIRSGQFGVLTGEPITLEAVFSRAAGEHLFETPLSADQDLVADEAGRLHLRATVPSTRALVWWLLGFGDGVTVEGPASLREEMRLTAVRMAQGYGAGIPADSLPDAA